MTDEIKLTSDRYSEIAGLLYNKDPSVAEIYPIIQRHINIIHGFSGQQIPSFKQLYLEIEHLDAVLANRRDLGELKITE